MWWVKWHSSFISRYSSSYFLEILSSLPSFLILTSLYLLNCTNSVLLLHLITLRLTTFCRIPPDKWSAQRTDLYFTAHNTHNTRNSQHTTLKTHKSNNTHQRTPRDSKPQSQKSSRPKPTPQTARPPGSAFPLIVCLIELQLVWFCVTQIG